jgi:hypothetical protein
VELRKSGCERVEVGSVEKAMLTGEGAQGFTPGSRSYGVLQQ